MPDAAQRDLLSWRDKLTEYQRSLRAAVARLTVKEVAYGVNLSPGSVTNQLTQWNKRKHPSAEMGFWCLADETHMREVTGAHGWLLVKPPRLTEGEALRIVQERALAKGFVSADELMRLLQQTQLTPVVAPAPDQHLRAVGAP